MAGAPPPPSAAVAAASPPPILVDNPSRPGADEVTPLSLRTPLSLTHETDPNPIPFPAMARARIHPYHQQWPPGAAPPPSTAASPPPILVDSPNRPGAGWPLGAAPPPSAAASPPPILVDSPNRPGTGWPLGAAPPPSAAASPPPILVDSPNRPGTGWPLGAAPPPSAAASPPPILDDNPNLSALRSVINQMSERGVFPWKANNVALKDPVKLRENSRKYLKLLSATECFYAGDWDKEDLDPIFNGVFRWPETCDDACTAARFALSLYNNNEGMELEFKKLIRVNGQLLKDTIFFLTMEASDGLFYEAKVLYESRTNMKVFFVRVAHHYPVISPEIQHLTGPTAGQSSRQGSSSSEDSGQGLV